MSRRIPALLAALAVLLGIVLTGVPAYAAGVHVTIARYAFGPGDLMVTAGDTVTWTNQDAAGHDVTATSGPAPFHSPPLAQGQSWTFTFTVPGTADPNW